MEREESDLYGLPLAEFIPARTALERRLRRDGEREWAAAVKKLPKPSVAAWAVNQASRSQPKDRRELLKASADLREAQERLIAGDASAANLEKAARRQRAAIEALTDAAAGLLTGDGKGVGEATLARVRETLAAVAGDDEVAALVESGTLDRERRPAGLGFGFELGEPAPEPREKSSTKGGGSKPSKPTDGRAPKERSGARRSCARPARGSRRRRRKSARPRSGRRRPNEVPARRPRRSSGPNGPPTRRARRRSAPARSWKPPPQLSAPRPRPARRPKPSSTGSASTAHAERETRFEGRRGHPGGAPYPGGRPALYIAFGY